MPTALVVNAAHDLPTAYLESWTAEVVNRIRARGTVHIVELAAAAATRENLERTIADENPKIVILNGHGAADRILGFKYCILIKSDDNAAILAERDVHALSCQAGKNLGPQVITLGGKSFIGYADDFQFWHEGKTDPAGQVSDNIASPTLEPAFRAIEALLEGDSAEEAFRKSQLSYAEKLLALITNPDSTYNTTIAACTAHNRKNQVILTALPQTLL